MTLPQVVFRPDRLELFWRFVYERQVIWRRRVVLQCPPPWTNDPILHHERFTNVYRELDPGTQYVLREILEQDASKPDKVFNTMLYRLIGRAETHAALGFQHLADFDPEHLRAVLRRFRDQGHAPFTAAYMVSAYTSMGTADKIENVARLFAKLSADFPAFYVQLVSCRTLESAHGVLSSVYGFGNFLAYQVLVDLLYPLRVYSDAPLLPFSHNDWASAGPGARRGIAMLLNDDVPRDDLAVMRWLRQHQRDEFDRLGLDFPYLTTHTRIPLELTLANIQNCLCEFHKYVKIRAGTGRGRRKFRPSCGEPRQLAFHFMTVKDRYDQLGEQQHR